MIHFEINVELEFHETLWKKNFTVYPSLKISTKSSAKHCNSEKFCIVRNISLMFFFFFTNLSQRNCLSVRICFYTN